jgi:hypothetical protein
VDEWQNKRLTDAELHALFDRLFPYGSVRLGHDLDRTTGRPDAGVRNDLQATEGTGR